MSRRIATAVMDVTQRQAELADRHLNMLPVATRHQWGELADRCIVDATLPNTDDERYRESVELAAYCYEQMRRAR